MKKKLTVSELNLIVKTLIETEPLIKDIWVEGEITNLRQYKFGKQLYFTLSDGNSQLNCVVYENFLKGLKFDPKNGDHVDCRGSLKLFHKRGSLSFQVVFMQKEGLGNQGLSFDALKKKLQAEGLFDSEIKKELPRVTATVGIITAENSAALADFQSIMTAQTPEIKIQLFPAIMQGNNCPQSVISALKASQKQKGVGVGLGLDLIVIMRGGGSAEDLAGFNDEALVREIGDCAIPCISAIGHEIDYSLCDFVADLRVETPSAAAKLIASRLLRYQDELKQRLKDIGTRLQYQIENTESAVDRLVERLRNTLYQKIDHYHHDCESLKQRLKLANPLQKFDLGYSISYRKKDGQKLSTVSDIEIGEKLSTELKDGIILSEVLSKKTRKTKVKRK